MFLAKKWGILIKKESKPLINQGMKIPRDYCYNREEIFTNIAYTAYQPKMEEEKWGVLSDRWKSAVESVLRNHDVPEA